MTWLLAQAVVAPDTEMMKWAYQTGGPLMVLIVIILFFYRRDAMSSLHESEAKNVVVVELARAMSSSMTSCTAEVSRLARAVEQLDNDTRKRQT